MIRCRQDILAELSTLDARIASNRKSAETTLNAKSAQIADATLPSLERKRAALLDELATAPERPAPTYARSFRFNERTTPMTAQELDAMEIPAFLDRRTKR